jgi:hypothetical protein
MSSAAAGSPIVCCSTFLLRTSQSFPKARDVLRYGTTRILDAGLNDIVNYIRTVGPCKFRYHLDIEIRNHRTSRTWTERLMSRPSLRRPEQMDDLERSCSMSRRSSGSTVFTAPSHAISYWRRNAHDFSLIKAIRSRQSRPAPEEMKEFLNGVVGQASIRLRPMAVWPAAGSPAPPPPVGP